MPVNIDQGRPNLAASQIDGGDAVCAIRTWRRDACELAVGDQEIRRDDAFAVS
jgi:hypothetical protein